MPTNRNTPRQNPFRNAARPMFSSAEPQEEAISRIDYLREHGGGWCAVSGPRGIGKSMLLKELACRAAQRGERCSCIDLAPDSSVDWLTLVAETWGIHCSQPASVVDVVGKLQEHLIGWATLNRPVWLLCDQSEPLSLEFVRGCRWLSSVAGRHELRLIVVIACRGDADRPHAKEEPDLHLELWPWERDDCAKFVEQCLQSAGLDSATFTPEAVSALHERSEGVPGTLAKLCEFTWLAGQAELESQIGSDLVHAIADELLSSPPRATPLYEMSAGYGAW